MGLTSSKEPRDIKVIAADVGIVRITEDAIGNIERTVKSEQKQQPRVEEEQPSSTRQVTFTKSDLEAKTRLDEYETRLVTSFEKASKEVDDLFKKRYQSTPICQLLQQQVQQCYEQNKQQTLNCIEIVNKYIKCVENERFKLSTSNGA